MGRARTLNLSQQRLPGSRTTKAVGYCRRSTDRQEQSIPDQKAAIEKYANERGFTMLRFYIDDAISGTTTVGRRAFEQLVEDAKRPSCEFGQVLVYDVKRFGRIDNDEAGYYRYILKTHGVDVCYCAENFTGDRTDDLLRPVKQWQAREESKDLSKVTIRGLLSRAASLRLNVSGNENIGALSGGGWWMGGAPPYGFDLSYESRSGEFLFFLRFMRDRSRLMYDENWRLLRRIARGESMAGSRKDRCKLVPSEPQRVKTIQRVFELYVNEGYGFKSIAVRLNREGVLTPRGPEWASYYSGHWSTVGVRCILTNPAYCGDMVWNRRTDARFHRIADGHAVERKGIHRRCTEWNDESDWIVVPAAHEALVSKRVWQLARERLVSNARSERQRYINQQIRMRNADANRQTNGHWEGPRAKFLLSSLMTCSRCGSRYEGRIYYGKRIVGGLYERQRSYVYGCGGYIKHGRSVCILGPVAQTPLEEAVTKTVIDFYQRYVGFDGKQRVRAALGVHMDRSHEDLTKRRRSLHSVTRKIDQTVRNLLDNVTAINRDMIDQRLLELRQQRDCVDAELGALEHMNLSMAEVEAFVDETIAFAGSLSEILRNGLPDARTISLRRCIAAMEIDSERCRAMIRLRIAPYIGLGSGLAATEPMDIQWKKVRQLTRARR